MITLITILFILIIILAAMLLTLRKMAGRLPLKDRLKMRMRKRDVVGAVITYPDKRIKEFLFIPKNESFDYKGNSYLITKEGFFLRNGIPTYFYASDKSYPIDPNQFEFYDRSGKLISDLTKITVKDIHGNVIPQETIFTNARKLHLFKQSKSISELNKANQETIPITLIQLLLSGATLAAVAYAIYMIMQVSDQLSAFFGGV